ncbi:MAG: toll/interleukin-1 receptor domain-containing protein [Bryobacteraceae bacterium]|nr:toll/interleukin-1 receptor domain-containing protein [Bryobacteraceae bacterium]
MAPSVTGFEYACFISWARKSGPNVRRVAETFRDALGDALHAWGIHQTVFLDFRDLEAGDAWEPQIAEKLCRSCTMVAFCGPDYYRSEFCSREWNSMEVLGCRRLGKEHGLILPVKVAPYRATPAQISRTQWLCDISKEIQAPPANLRNTKWFRQMVEQAHERITQAHGRLGPSETSRCGGHKLSRPGWRFKEVWKFPVL